MRSDGRAKGGHVPSLATSRAYLERLLEARCVVITRVALCSNLRHGDVVWVNLLRVRAPLSR